MFAWREDSVLPKTYRNHEEHCSAYKSKVFSYKPFRLFDPTSHYRTQCVSLLYLLSPSLPLWHHQSLLPPLTPAPRDVLSSAFTVARATPALKNIAGSFYALDSWFLCRSKCWLLNKFYCHSSNGDLGIAGLQALLHTLKVHTLYMRECILDSKCRMFIVFPPKGRSSHLWSSVIKR